MVLKNREAIKKAGKNATDLQSKLLTKHREPIMDKMESGIKKALETLKECDPNPARSSKVAHDVDKSVKIYQEIYDEKIRNAKQFSIYSFFKPVRHAIPVTPADPTTAGPSTSAANGSTSSISSFFKLVKHAEPVTAGPSTSASDSADDDVFEGFEPPASPPALFAHSAEDE
ncbi:hypothetical protein E2C01_052573 [Portunus trituberculatus]|uniref:Uncharacterized protein n=1 Tax=Portunus trituberculatus TaxID=210409 RepID=A0A5B7GLV5_PORTR|nr:hypothetical protein [Portunus trituberculatus]